MEPKNSPACVELFSKLKVPEGPVSTWSRKQCVDWLKDIGVSHSGTKEDLILKNLKFQKYPALLKKIKDRANRNYKFLTSSSPSDIPPSTSLWKQENILRLTNLFLRVTVNIKDKEYLVSNRKHIVYSKQKGSYSQSSSRK